MLILWFLVLSLLLVGYLGSPWYRPSAPLYDEANLVDELMLERERTYTALVDLDFDYEAGKLSEPDYQKLRQQLLGEAAQVLANIDLIAEGKHPKVAMAEPDDPVEAAIARYKQQRKQ